MDTNDPGTTWAEIQFSRGKQTLDTPGKALQKKIAFAAFVVLAVTAHVCIAYFGYSWLRSQSATPATSFDIGPNHGLVVDRTTKPAPRIVTANETRPIPYEARRTFEKISDARKKGNFRCIGGKVFLIEETNGTKEITNVPNTECDS